MSFTKRYIESLGLRSSAQLRDYITSVDFSYDKKQKEDLWWINYKEQYDQQLTERQEMERTKEIKNL